MNKLLIALGFIASGFIGWLIGGKEPSEIKSQINDTTIAVVNNKAISKEDFIKKMEHHGGLRAGQFHKLEQRESLLTFLVNQEVMFTQALEKGIEKDPAVMSVYKKAVIDRYLERELEPLLANVKISNREVETYFNDNKKSYDRPARRRGAIIFVKNSLKDSAETKLKNKQRIQEALDKIQGLDEKTMHFGELAKQYSDDRNSRYQGGVIGWLINHPSRKYRWDDEVVESLFALKANGDTSSIIETKSGYYIVRLVATENIQEKALAKVQKGIKNSLIQKKKKQFKTEFLTELIDNADISINQNLLASIEPISKAVGKNKKKPPALPGTGGE
jgi:peptidyl-prolyl cis-trans isomerase C